MEKRLHELSCEGSHYEMGFAQGVWLSRKMDGILRSLTHNDLIPRVLKLAGPKVLWGLLILKGHAVRKRHLENMARHSRPQLERLHGIADGSRTTLELVLGLASIETMAANFQFVLGCTSLVVGRSRTKKGDPLLAYNHDFPSLLKDHLIVRRTRPQDGWRSLQVTYPPMPGAICGVNEVGLAVSLNHAFTTEPFNDGVPPTFLVQQALDRAGSTEEAVKMFRKVTFSCGSLATVVDRDGHMAALELSRGHFGVRKPVDDISLTLNDYRLSELRRVEVPQEARFDPHKFPKSFHGLEIHRPNWERRSRFNSILEALKDKKVSPGDLRRCLSDHQTADGGYGTICRHHPTGDTILSAIVFPKEGKIEACRGHACRGQYQEFRIC